MQQEQIVKYPPFEKALHEKSSCSLSETIHYYCLLELFSIVGSNLRRIIEMPFYGYTGIPAPDDPSKMICGIVMKWLVREGTYVQQDTPVAEVSIENTIFEVVICFEALIEKHLTNKGAVSETDRSLLRWGADGEKIPYGRTYFLTRKKDV